MLRRRLRAIDLAVIAALLAGGCGAPSVPPARPAAGDPFRDLLVTAAQCEAPSARSVGPADMAADRRALARILRRGYAGAGVAGEPEAWRAFFERSKTGLPDEPLSAAAFRDRLAEQLRFVRDNHLAPWTRDAAGRRRVRRPGAHHANAWIGALSLERRGGHFVDARGHALLGCDGEPPSALLRATWDTKRGSVEHRPIALAADEPEPLDCTMRSADGRVRHRRVPLRRLRPARDPGPPLGRRTLGEAITWLRLRTLSPSRREALHRFVQTAPSVREHDVVVLDLRGNGGGSDAFLRDWFLGLTDRRLAYFDSERVHSEVTLQGDVNFWRCRLAALEARGEAEPRQGRAWVRGRLERARRVLASHARVHGGPFVTRFERRSRARGRAPEPFGGTLVLVVDAACASACEAAVMYGRQLPGTLVVGENTAGADAFTEVRSYRLPHSGVWVTAGMKRLRDPRLGRFPEGIGYEPDLWLGGDAVERGVRSLARCLAAERCAHALREELGPVPALTGDRGARPAPRHPRAGRRGG